MSLAWGRFGSLTGLGFYMGAFILNFAVEGLLPSVCHRDYLPCAFKHAVSRNFKWSGFGSCP